MRAVLAIMTTLFAAIHIHAAFDELASKLDAAVRVLQERLGTQGVSACVSMNGRYYAMTSGQSYLGRPITPSMVFGIGSNTKTLTALVLLRLQEEGRIDLDDAIGQYIEPHPYIDPSITVRQLLNHTSGLGEYAGGVVYRDSILTDPQRVWTAGELLPMIPSPAFAPGTSAEYCNTNYLVAGIIAERVGASPLQDLYRRLLTEPLDLDTLVLFPQDSCVGELAHRWMGGRDASNRPMQAEWSGAWAAGAALSTAYTYARLYERLFSGNVLTDVSMGEFTDVRGPARYGLGIDEDQLGGQTAYGHGGNIRGYTSSAYWIPALGAAVVVLTNDAEGRPRMVVDSIVRVLSDHVTSVDDEDPLESYDLFPGTVYDLNGTVVGTVRDHHALRSLRPGPYILRQDRGSHMMVMILPDGMWTVRQKAY